MKFFKQLSLITILLGTLTIHVEGQDLNLENSLLWKIEKKHAKTSYLFGTIHMISEGDFFISKHVEKAFRKSQALFMEIDISNEEEMMSIMQYANMSDGKTLMDLLSPSDYALLESTMRELTGIEMASLNSFKPFVLESFLIQNMIEGPIESYEMTFAEMAKKDEIPILGLESVKEQMALFEKAKTSQSEFIVSRIDDHVFIRIPKAKQHFWSPQLHLEINKKEDESSSTIKKDDYSISKEYL